MNLHDSIFIIHFCAAIKSGNIVKVTAEDFDDPPDDVTYDIDDVTIGGRQITEQIFQVGNSRLYYCFT